MTPPGPKDRPEIQIDLDDLTALAKLAAAVGLQLTVGRDKRRSPDRVDRRDS